MESVDIAYQRLYNQRLAGAKFSRPEDVVSWLGAVQSQEFLNALWALGLRMHDASEASVEQAFTDGDILRTHIMRPTWHFVTSADIRWLIALTAPRVNAANAYYYRQLELDDALFGRASEVIAEALRGGKHLTRAELANLFSQAGIVASGLRLGYIFMRAELDALICSGARRGKQHTYALLEERAPHAKALMRDEALAELTRRYFTGHGPATLKDYSWWSGLTMSDVKAGLEMVKPWLMREEVEGQTYWFSQYEPVEPDIASTGYLLPDYDEYFIAYKDRSAMFDPAYIKKLNLSDDFIFSPPIVVGGRLVGSWKRVLKKGEVVVTARPLSTLSDAVTHAFTEAARRYGEFLGLPVTLA